MTKKLRNFGIVAIAMSILVTGASFVWPTTSSQVSTASANNEWCRTVPIKSATASNTLPGSSPNNVFDGNFVSNWNSGDFAEQWIEVTLDGVFDVYGVQMKTEQFPEGDTTHAVWTGNTWPNQKQVSVVTGYTQTAQWLKSEFAKQTGVTKVTVKTTDSPSWVAWREIQVCGDISSITPTPTPPPTTPVITPCPTNVSLPLSKTSLAIGESMTLSYPSGWSGGSFAITNPSVLRVQGNTVTALQTGSAQVYGSGMRAGTAWPCTTAASSINVRQPDGRMTPGYQAFSTCRGPGSMTIEARSTVPAQIKFDRMVNGGPYYGSRSADVTTPDGMGGFVGRITVYRSDFNVNDQVWFRLYTQNGQPLFGGQYAAIAKTDHLCSRTISF